MALDRSGVSAFITVTPFLELCSQMLDDELANSLVMTAIWKMPLRGSRCGQSSVRCPPTAISKSGGCARIVSQECWRSMSGFAEAH